MVRYRRSNRITQIIFVLFVAQQAYADDEPMPGNGPQSEQGQQRNQRPLTNPRRDLLRTEVGKLSVGATAAASLADPFPSYNIEFISQLTLADMGAGTGAKGNDIWGWTDPLDDKEYALVGRSDGTAFVDISIPAAPVYLGFLASQTGNTAWRDIKVYADHAYIVSDNNGSHGMQVFDLTQLRSVSVPPVSFTATALYTDFNKGHNIVINEATGFAYVVGSETYAGGLNFIDLTNPTVPVAAGGFSADGYTHDTQVVIYAGPDTTYSGREIAFNSNEDTLTIVDVTDKGTPVQLSRSGYPNGTYTHQGWLTEDHAYFVSNDELDERNDPSVNFTRTHLWNVSDIDAPVYIGYYEATVQSIDHNLYIHDGLIYAANYTTGLRVLDHSDIANGNLTEVAYIDTHPSKDSLTAFDGAWSSYPFFASGNVIIGDRDEGLLVVRLLRADLAVSGVDLTDPVVQGNQFDYVIDVTNNGPYPASNVILSSLLPVGAAYVQSVPSQGSCTETAGTVNCSLGTLNDGLIASVSITVTADNAGLLTNTSSVSGDEIDSNASDNMVVIDTTVLPDQDGDGLDDDFEIAIGTNPLLPDTDGDGVTDYFEVAFDGDASSYTPGLDTNPLLADTDGDGHGDLSDPIPLTFNFDDGDIAPLGAPNGLLNAADLLIANKIALGVQAVTEQELSHGDLYPPGAPDGIIDLSDMILLQKIVLQ